MLKKTITALGNRRLHRSIGALAGLTSALSVLVGMLAAYSTPRGWGRVTMALHLTKKPLLLKLAPFITGASVAVATAAGLLGFYVWLTDRDEAGDGKADVDG
jgi:hypothetical protein